MTPDDPRHGTPRGHYAGCREACCRAARARYEKAGRLARLRGGRAMPALGAQRRIQALMRLGWTSEDIARAAGFSHRNAVLRILHGQKGKPCSWLERKTFEAVAVTYEQMCMALPPSGGYHGRMRRIAERKGYAPPLAWNNIDDPDEHPRGTRDTTAGRDDIDPIVVERVLSGDVLPTTVAEKREVTRRWVAAGRSLNALERLTGWNSSRYGEQEAS